MKRPYGPTDGRTDGRTGLLQTNGPTDGRTDPLIEMRIQNTKYRRTTDLRKDVPKNLLNDGETDTLCDVTSRKKRKKNVKKKTSSKKNAKKIALKKKARLR